MEITRKALEKMELDEIIDMLVEEGNNCIHTREYLRAFAANCVNDENFLIAKHLITALAENDCKYFNYDMDMGVLEKPTPITEIDDVIDFIDLTEDKLSRTIIEEER